MYFGFYETRKPPLSFHYRMHIHSTKNDSLILIRSLTSLLIIYIMIFSPIFSTFSWNVVKYAKYEGILPNLGDYPSFPSELACTERKKNIGRKLRIFSLFFPLVFLLFNYRCHCFKNNIKTLVPRTSLQYF